MTKHNPKAPKPDTDSDWQTAVREIKTAQASKPKPKARPKALKKGSGDAIQAEPEPTFLIPADDERAAWRERGVALGKALSEQMREIGEWLCSGEAKWGDMYGEAAEITGYSEGTLRNIKSVYTRFHLSRQHDNLLPFWYYQEAAALSDEDAHPLLEQAETERPKRAEFRMRITALKKPDDATGNIRSTVVSDQTEAGGGDDPGPGDPGAATGAGAGDDPGAGEGHEDGKKKSKKTPKPPESSAEVHALRVGWAFHDIHSAMRTISHVKNFKTKEIITHVREQGNDDPETRKEVREICKIAEDDDPTAILDTIIHAMKLLNQDLQNEYPDEYETKDETEEVS